MDEYVTKAGDTVASVTFKFYGSTKNRVVEQVLDANRGLADRGARLPAGVTIQLPAIATPATTTGTKLWD